MSTKSPRGVFCLETDWFGNLKKPTTVQPILEFLQKLDGFEVPHIYRSVGTRVEFEFYVDKWAQKTHEDYPILYLAFHGEEGKILVGDKRRRDSRVTLEELSERLKGKCKHRIILFGSCSTMNTERKRLQAFLKRTGALAVFGYKSDVDWFSSAMFEVQLLATMQQFPLNRRGIRKMEEKIRAALPQLSKELTFRMEIAGD